MSRKLRLALASTGTALALASTASADGLPVPFDGAGNVGVPSLEGGLRYSAVNVGERTAILKVASGTGDILHTATLDGTWAIPLVAYDSTPSGLSADGDTLAVIEPRKQFPRETTTLGILDANKLQLRDRIELRGDFSFDAISPDGRTIFLIEYTDPRDPTAYEVRAYDVRRDRLLPDPIVDPNESGEEMAGYPQTRAVSPDGRWAYTLYSFGGRHHPPFIHALDTKHRTAVCIDLDALADHRRIDRLSLSPSADGSTLAVTQKGEPLLTVDLSTYEVSEPPPPTAAADGAGDDDERASILGWAVLGGGLAFLVAAVAMFTHRRREPVGEAELERLVDLPSEERERDQVG